MGTRYADLLVDVLKVARQASLAIMEYYQNTSYQVHTKADSSPVTEADLRAHEIIERGLAKIDPQIPFLSEESPSIPFAVRSAWPRYWLVDPLDGTREFIQGSGEFTVNIALIENHSPVLGVVLAPYLEQKYWALKGGQAFFQEKESQPVIIHTNPHHEGPIKVAMSRHHNSENAKLLPLLERFEQKPEIIYCGSALKICLVARGLVDLYPRFGPTGEWDTAAGQCILEASGGQLVDFRGKALQYNRNPIPVNPGFFASSCVELLAHVVDKNNP